METITNFYVKEPNEGVIKLPDHISTVQEAREYCRLIYPLAKEIIREKVRSNKKKFRV